jgi:gluconolactonase
VVYYADQWIPDGIKVVKSGNIYTAAGNFIDVIDPSGVLLGKIYTPTFTTNLVFSGSGGLWLVGQGAAYRVLLAELE